MAAVEAPAVARALHESLVQTLEANGAAGQLDEVINAFIDLVRGSGPREAEVTSAVEVEPAQREAIMQQLRAKYGAGLEIRFTVDPSILGGLVMRVGDKVLDDSVRSRLATLQQRMLVS